MPDPPRFREGQADQLSPVASCALLLTALMLIAILAMFIFLINTR